MKALKEKGLTRWEIEDKLIDAGLDESHIPEVLGPRPEAKVYIKPPETRQKRSDLLKDVADNLDSIRIKLGDVKPKHFPLLEQLEILSKRCRDAS